MSFYSFLKNLNSQSAQQIVFINCIHFEVRNCIMTATNILDNGNHRCEVQGNRGHGSQYESRSWFIDIHSLPASLCLCWGAGTDYRPVFNSFFECSHYSACIFLSNIKSLFQGFRWWQPFVIGQCSSPNIWMLKTEAERKLAQTAPEVGGGSLTDWRTPKRRLWSRGLSGRGVPSSKWAGGQVQRLS